MSDQLYDAWDDACNRVRELEHQLAEREKQIVLLRTALDNANQIITFEGVPYHLLGIEDRDEALDATQDLAGGIICDAEPVAWFHVADDGSFVTQGNLLAGGERLYKARKP
jgi:hypothetical protein